MNRFIGACKRTFNVCIPNYISKKNARLTSGIYTTIEYFFILKYCVSLRFFSVLILKKYHKVSVLR